jgi:hypothetical protein
VQSLDDESNGDVWLALTLHAGPSIIMQKSCCAAADEWHHGFGRRYRTQLCNDGTNCKRRVCFFAHTLSELRVPSSKPFVNPQALAAAAAAAGARRTSFSNDQVEKLACHLPSEAVSAALHDQVHHAASSSKKSPCLT